MNPRVSVVLPVFNGEPYLGQAVQSILEQSFTDFELIAVDDGSTDRTADLLAAFQKKDARIRVVRQERQGIVMALNRGCETATGQYIARMDADDVSLCNRLQVQVAFLDAHPHVDVLGTGYRHLDGETLSLPHRNPRTHGLIEWRLCFYNCLCHPSVMMRREKVAELGFYRSAYPHCEDYDLWIRACTRLRLANLDDVLLLYRSSLTGISNSKRECMNESHLRLMQVLTRRVGGRTVTLPEVAALRQIQLEFAAATPSTFETARTLLMALRNGFIHQQHLTDAERSEVERDVRVKCAHLFVARCKRNPLAVLDIPRTWRFVGDTQLVRRTVSWLMHRLLRLARFMDDSAFNGAAYRIFVRLRNQWRARFNPSMRPAPSSVNCDGEPRARQAVRFSDPRKTKVVFWGHPLHSHTHSYIHYACFRAFYHLGYEVVWADGSPTSIDDAANVIFFTEGQVDRHIPLLRHARYILHNCNTAKYREVGARVLKLQVLSTAVMSCDGLQTVGHNAWFDARDRTLYQPWATDLLPHEMDAFDLIMADSRREPRIYWVGTVGAGPYGNHHEILEFARACRARSVDFIEGPKHISAQENIDYIRRSYLAPAIQGPWQLEHGYIPCRIFKNLSYGHLGVTNSRTVFDMLDGQITYHPDCYRLFEAGERDMHRHTRMHREQVRRLVAERHTYLNRIENILKVL